MPNITNQAETPRLRISRSKLIIGTVISLAILTLVGLWISNNKAASQALNLATTRQSERFSELYFNNSGNLPKLVATGTPASFSYRVVNHEATDVTYLARITIVENGRLRVLEQDRFLIHDGAGHTVTVKFTTAQPDTNLELIVELVGQNQSIHFRSQS